MCNVPWDLNLLIVLLWAWAVEISGEEYQNNYKENNNNNKEKHDFKGKTNNDWGK